MDDPKAALLLLEHVESWFRTDEFETIQRMKLALSKIEAEPLIYTEELNLLLKDVRAYGQVPDENNGRKAYNKLARSVKGFLKRIKSKPRFSFLATEKHRSFVIDSIALAQTSISLASDQLRPIGFDLTIRNLILRKFLLKIL